MKTGRCSDHRRMKAPEKVVPRAQNTSDLFQVFALELAQCPRFDRTAEYTLARHTHAAWRCLLRALAAHHDHLMRLLSPRLLPSSYDTMSESDIVRLLRHVQERVERTQGPQSSPAIASTRDWLAHMQANLAHFRYCRDEMVRRNLRFVVMLARRYLRSPVDLLDLVQEGTLGLMRAVEKFDPDRGIRFASYAVWWVREAFARTRTARENTTWFSDATPEEEETDAFVDRIAAPEETTPEVRVLNAERATHLCRALAILPEPEADILRLRFGLGEPRPCTLAEVSHRLSLTREQVRVREQRALVRLRVYLSHYPGFLSRTREILNSANGKPLENPSTAKDSGFHPFFVGDTW
jgi:RNA polymerase primary sigma factor